MLNNVLSPGLLLKKQMLMPWVISSLYLETEIQNVKLRSTPKEKRRSEACFVWICILDQIYPYFEFQAKCKTQNSLNSINILNNICRLIIRLPS